jgi:hypothetical protein
LHQGPGEEARPQAAATAQGPPPSRWTLDTIRATFDWLRDYSLSGVWRYLQRLDLRLRSARVQQFSPDPAYAAKVRDLEMALWEARRYPDRVVAVFLDQMGFTRWPAPAPDWAAATPVADRHGSKQGLWRTMGALNAWTGQVTYVDGYIVGRAKVIECYGGLVAAATADRILTGHRMARRPLGDSRSRQGPSPGGPPQSGVGCLPTELPLKAWTRKSGRTV